MVVALEQRVTAPFPAVDIGGIPIHACSMEGLCAWLKEAVPIAKVPVLLSFANPEFIMEAISDPALNHYLRYKTSVNAPDGVGLLLAARRKGMRLPERVTGTDFVWAIAQLSEEAAWRVFLYGARPGVAKRAAAELKLRFPRIRIAGTRDGYSGNPEADVAAIRDSRPEVLMVCTGNPNQERFIAAYGDQLGAKLIFGNGGALDFTAGDTRRAPKWVRRLSLEWLDRLLRDFRLTRIRRQIKLIPFVLRFLVAGR